MKGSGVLGGNDFSEFFDQRLEFLRHGIPDNILVDVHVIVHDLAPHACNGLPRNLWMPIAELRRNAASGLADHLDEMREC